MPVVPLEKYFYSKKEVAASFAVSVRSVDYLISEQKLRTRRFKRRVLIPAEDVRRLKEEINADKMVG